MAHFLLYKDQYYNAANILRIMPSVCHKFVIIELSHTRMGIVDLFMECWNSETSDTKFGCHETIEFFIELLNQPKSTIITVKEYEKDDD